MNEETWKEAEAFARRPYGVQFEYDLLSDGQKVVVAKNPDLPGCMAQGKTEEEARKNLLEARVDYIYYLLVDDLPVPEPSSLRSSSTRSCGKEQNTILCILNYASKLSPQCDQVDDDESAPDYFKFRIEKESDRIRVP